MIAVIFEVEPADRDAYFRIAAELRLLLDEIDGFVSIERFQSLNDDGRVLSLSFWRDEEAVKRWRNVDAHRLAQRVGRGGVFRDYRLRVAEVVRDYGMNERTETPADSPEVHSDVILWRAHDDGGS
ncbi:antibiotic biosynthesis monooxygenase family protein [Candidatus Viadribacter manganicus]|uniref:Antibiotic biosynthesis monooxygenase n=1 Tax=Candidatus Viadribacter manganicus TaxID=1759059 RepID=A0A1B1AES1_9PROT|nr:antibiotic biosynthesis monooxygenase [Candidatus Viadribacter manganicus]ANP45066.1 antibiotic biosynthesis monooxygenase [Candidatus Viadribacter manganicus]